MSSLGTAVLSLVLGTAMLVQSYYSYKLLYEKYKISAHDTAFYTTCGNMRSE